MVAALLVCAAPCATALLVDCKAERVHVTTLLVDGDDGGALRGFDCVETPDGGDDASSTTSCVLSTCLDACRGARATNAECLKDCTNDGGVRQACSQSLTVPVMARANGKRVCVVLDYLATGGELECRSISTLLSWCDAPEHRSCPIIERHVVPVTIGEVPITNDAGAGAADPPESAVDQGYAAIHEALQAVVATTTSSPGDWVVLRLQAVATDASDCKELEQPSPAPDLSAVLGCATSCPVVLANFDQVSLVLDDGLALFGACRANAVQACAAFGTAELHAAIAALRRDDPAAP